MGGSAVSSFVLHSGSTGCSECRVQAAGRRRRRTAQSATGARPASTPVHTMTSEAGATAAGEGEGGDSGDVTVRLATREDMPTVLKMIHELAEFEGHPNGPQLSVEDLIKDGFESSPPWFFVLLAERGGGAEGAGGAGGAAGAAGREVVGHALCSRAYSSWTRRAYYVEDLFVRPAARRGGVGRALLRHLAQECVRVGATRVDWHVLASNAAARAFYSRLGARDLRAHEGRLALRLDEPQIRALAISD